MLHKITSRAVKCGPAAISAIAGVPTHEAAAVIRRLYDRRAVNGVFIDELTAGLAEFGWAPDYAIRHPRYGTRHHARRESEWERHCAGVPFEVRAVTLGTFLDPAPAGTWAIPASGDFVAYADGVVADSNAWFSRRPAVWLRGNPDHGPVALRRLREAVRFVPAARDWRSLRIHPPRNAPRRLDHEHSHDRAERVDERTGAAGHDVQNLERVQIDDVERRVHRREPAAGTGTGEIRQESGCYDQGEPEESIPGSELTEEMAPQ